jgi:hypothetical protein
LSKRAFIVSLVVVLLAGASSAWAEDARYISAEVFGGFATEPEDDLDIGYGIGAGLNLPFGSVFRTSSEAATKDLYFRLDVTYFKWEDGPREFTRIPIFLGLRYYLSPERLRQDKLALFGEAGLELSFDEKEKFGRSDDDVDIGFPLGIGLQYFITETVYVGGNVRLHLISDNYLSFLASIGFAL